MKKHVDNALILAGILATALPAQACGTCTAALLWGAFPPFLWWVGIGILWYLALVVISTVAKVNLPLIPGPIAATLLVVGAAITSMIALGPLLLLALAIAPILATFAYLAGKVRNPLATRLISWAGLTALIALVATGYIEISHAASMDEADKIAMWHGTTTTRQWQRKLRDQEPASADKYRKLLRLKPDSYESMDSAERLALISSSPDDVDLILKSAIAVEDESSMQDGYRKALETMTSVTLPENLPPSQWRSAIIASEPDKSL